MAIATPVVLAEGHDVVLFRSVSEAEAHVEAIDVDNGVYRAWDATGVPLQLVADGPRGLPTSRKVHIHLGTPSAGAAAELAKLLTGVLVELGAEAPDAGEALPVLVTRFVKAKGYP